jgi:amino acid adenylation domain-containing protein
LKNQFHRETSLLHALDERCRSTPSRPAVVSLRDDLSISATLSWQDFMRRAWAIAWAVEQTSKRGDRVLLAYDNGTEVVAAFWGTMLAGRVPVPAPAPSPSTSKQAPARLKLIARDCGAAVALTTSSHKAVGSDQVGFCRWIATDKEIPTDGERALGTFREVHPHEVAYLQYTSGSTREPRGVVISHSVLAAHSRSVIQATSMDANSAVLTWLPYFHDYGLVLGAITPLVAGCPSYLMTPRTFLRRPLRWLEAMEKYGITHSGAPNFAYESCARALSRDSSWRGDLSSWRFASCGAEAVQPETVEKFSAAFEPHGFSRIAFTPGYGLAEATLVLSIKRPGVGPRITGFSPESLAQGRAAVSDHPDATRLVSNGPPLADARIAIVDPVRLEPVRAGELGEIWASGPTIGKGYWGRAAESVEVFRARISGQDGEVFLRTGDIGFLHEEELYVAGRLKDLIIVRGRNYYPQDLEWSASAAHPVIRPGYAAAFAQRRSQAECAILVCESTSTDQDENARAISTIRGRIADDFGLELAEIVLVRPGTIPRTSSGKVQRQACRSLYEQGGLDQHRLLVRIDETVGKQPNHMVSRIASIWAEVLDLEDPGADVHMFERGGNSLLATQAVSRVNAEFDIEIPIRRIFEDPTPAAFAKHVAAALSNSEVTERSGIVPSLVQSPDTAPLSFSQRRMWILHRLAPQSSAYSMPVAVRLRGRINLEAMRRALARLTERHESLRTVFRFEDSEPYQLVQGAGSLPLEVLDVSSPTIEDRNTEASRLFQKLAQIPFDLENGPLARAYLTKLADDDWVLMLNKHHIIGDQWSYVILAQDLAKLYAEECGISVGPWRPVGISYPEYAIWQRRRLTDRALASQKEYWLAQLAGLEPLSLPTDYSASGYDRYHGARISRPFTPELRERLESLSLAHGATLFMSLLTAFQVLLSRYSGQHDIAVGVPIANRHNLLSEHLIGTLVNTLVLRLDLSGNPTFSDALARLRKIALDGYSNQDMPFEALVGELGSGMDRSTPPLVNVLFNVLNVPIGELEFYGLDWSIFDFDRGATQFDLTLTVDPQLLNSVSLEYSKDLFSPDTAARILDHYMQLLREAVDNPGKPISSLQMLLPDEVETFNRDSAATSAEYPAHMRTDELVAAQSSRSPHSIAIKQGGMVLRYEGLESAANRLARELRDLGARSGTRIGVCIERSPDMVVALLAIMKSGATYVPIDPSYPASRISFMVEDAQILFALTDASSDSIMASCHTRRIGLQETISQAARHPSTTLDDGISTEAPAYVLYTSGSTGKPKGVEVSHRSLVNLLWSMRREPGFCSRDVLLSFTTLSFDIAALELYLPLICGGTLALPSADSVTDARRLVAEIEAHRPTVMQATPAMWTMLMDAGWMGSPDMKILCGGEPLSRPMANQLLDRAATVWNMYGPTETTVWSLVDKVRPGTDAICIGRPIANTQIRVLDSFGAPVPIGATGELYIGGDGVAIGYVGRPELTASRFIPHPSSARRGDRLYRTGDLVRYRPDGRLIHLGRADHQVKIRGHRIELGEIEARLLEIPNVSQAVVVVQEVRPGDSRLAGYMVAGHGHLDIDQVRRHLVDALPRYMHPQYLVVMESLPILPNGKIDRQRLPRPIEQATQKTATVPGSYSSEAEKLLASIWCELLHVDQIEPLDNFFDLGGHSLLAVQAIAIMEKKTGRQISARHYVLGTFAQIAIAHASSEPG